MRGPSHLPILLNLPSSIAGKPELLYDRPFHTRNQTSYISENFPNQPALFQISVLTTSHALLIPHLGETL